MSIIEWCSSDVKVDNAADAQHIYVLVLKKFSIT